MMNTSNFLPENMWLNRVRYVLIHLLCVGIFFIPFTLKSLVIAFISYLIGMWGLEVCTHRYFSHKSFKTTRFFQFALALVGGVTGQRGVLWWVSRHRQHHMHADEAMDPQSPIINSWNNSLWFSQFGWPIARENSGIDLTKVRDWCEFPEIVLISRYYFLPPFFAAVLMFSLGHYGMLGADMTGIQSLLWGFVVPLTLVIQVGNAVNTLAHGGLRGGYRNFDTPDKSRNRPILALLTLGAGWHNNHHRFPASARSGFFNREIDIAYLTLVALSKIRLVWDLTPVPDSIIQARQNGNTTSPQTIGYINK